MHEAAPSSEHIRFGPFELHVRSGELDKGQTRLKVPDQSIEILKALLERPGELVTREELRKRLWPTDTFVDFEHGLNAAVRRLREALGDSADTPKFIETLPRRGYRFIGLVEGPSCEAVAAAPSATEAKSSPTQHPPVEPVRRRRVLWPHVVVVALVLLLAAGLGWIALTRHESASVRPAMPESIPVRPSRESSSMLPCPPTAITSPSHGRPKRQTIPMFTSS
jgi:DNA-binding winged helix-turn-helix (wHTH) protein